VDDRGTENAATVRAEIADARKALRHFRRPDVARARLAQARALAERLGLAAELAEIATLEAELPAPAGR
jgi:hypothetical protein